MSREILSIKRKALKINLEGSIYGTFAEIGAGQEVARTFFQVGGASGTVAKTMSAYDMAYSDAIYGVEESGRYVSESRLLKMLDHEYCLLEERLTDKKYARKRFFAFADTCAVLNFQRNNDPHSWMGIRFQLHPKGAVNEVFIHIRLNDKDALLQQRVIGAIGVNLLYACYWHSNDMDAFVGSLLDNLTTDQAEIDMIRVKGDDFAELDNRLLALLLVKKGFTDATIFGPDKVIYQPKDLLNKKHVLCLRGRFRPVTKVNMDMLQCGTEHCLNHLNCQPQELEVLMELTLNNLETDSEHGIQDFIDRAEILNMLGYKVMVSNCHKHDVLVQHINRCKPLSIEMIIGVMNIIELFNEDYYKNAPRELLEYFGNIFHSNTQMLVYPYQPLFDGPIMTVKNLRIPDSLSHIYEHLRSNNFLIDLDGYNRQVLQIFSPDVIGMIRKGTSGWESMVPDKVAEIIKQRCLFEYPCEVK